ncbi:MAG: alpha/beta hydrolase [Sandaracinaceae bacterium]
MLRGRIELPRLESRLLEGNPLGDPSEREALVYLPPSYDGRRRFPVVMVLPPYGAGHRSLLSFRLWEPTLFERYERLVAAGASREAILVVPDALTRWGGSQFLDSTATGPYQSYLVDEVLPFVDGAYRTIPERAGRAVVGRSSGGFGALRLGLDRPEAFLAYGSHAGDAAFELSLRPLLVPTAIAIEQAGGLIAFGERVGREGPGRGEFEAVMTLACAAAYAPAPERGWPFVELPFALRTAALDPEAWARWTAHDPLTRLGAEPAALGEAALVFLDAGDRDEHGLQFAARALADALAGRGVPVEHEEFPGGHRGTSHRYEASLPRLIAALAAG